jgi:hypothetical protein
MHKLEPPDWSYFNSAWAVVAVGLGFVLLGPYAIMGSALTILALALLIFSLWPSFRSLSTGDPQRQLARAYLAECVRPYEDPVILSQIWSPRETTPAYSDRLRTWFQAPPPLPETKALLQKVWGTERTASIKEARDLHRFIAEVSPKLARKGLLRWRAAMLSQFRKRRSTGTFSQADQVRYAAVIDLRMSLQERRNNLSQLLVLFDLIHSETIMTEAM